MPEHKPEWQVIVDLLRDTNPILLNRIGRKMMNYLYKRNISRIEVADEAPGLHLHRLGVQREPAHAPPEPGAAAGDHG